MTLFSETFILPFELTNGNDGRGSKWFKSDKIRKQFESDLCKLGLRRTPYPFPVRMTVTRILGKGDRLWDNSSILRGNWKELEDALVACQWIVDDSPRYVTACDGRQDQFRRSKGPAIEILIERDGVYFSGNEGADLFLNAEVSHRDRERQPATNQPPEQP